MGLSGPGAEVRIEAIGAAVRAVAQGGTPDQQVEAQRLLEALSRWPRPAAAGRLGAQLVRLGEAAGAGTAAPAATAGPPGEPGGRAALAWLLRRCPAPEADEREFPAAARAAVAAQVAARRARTPARAAPVEALLAALTGASG